MRSRENYVIPGLAGSAQWDYGLDSTWHRGGDTSKQPEKPHRGLFAQFARIRQLSKAQGKRASSQSEAHRFSSTLPMPLIAPLMKRNCNAKSSDFKVYHGDICEKISIVSAFSCQQSGGKKGPMYKSTPMTRRSSSPVRQHGRS